MSEENMEVNESSEKEWEAPPIPEEIPAEKAEEPEMSELGTVAGVFIEPGRTFEDLRRKPRFILAFIILAVVSMGFMIAFQQKVGEDNMRRFIQTQQDRSPQMATAGEAQKRQAVDIAMTFQKITTYAFPLIILLVMVVGGLFYWLGSKAMGGNAKFTHGFAVFIYSSLPPTIVARFADFIILFLKPADEIDIAASARGLVRANPTLLFDGKEMPVLATLISTVDVFVIWGLILAAIGLNKTAKISKGSSWAVVLILFLIGVTFRVIGALFSGNPS